MKKSAAAILLLLFFMLIPQMSSASFISIETTTTITVETYTAKISVTVTNKGDEAAHNGKVHIDIGGNHLTGKFMDILQVNVKNTEEFETNIDFKKPGKYPVTVMVEYTDANQYPFTALSVAFLNYKEPTNARVVGIIPQTSLAKNGKITLTVNNIDVTERKFHFRMVSPKEIFIANPESDISVDSGAEKTVSFDARNISALPGSSYPLFVLLEYEDGDHHYSAVNSGNILIKKQELLPDAYRKPLLVVLLAIFTGILFYSFRKIRLSRKRHMDE